MAPWAGVHASRSVAFRTYTTPPAVAVNGAVCVITTPPAFVAVTPDGTNTVANSRAPVGIAGFTGDAAAVPATTAITAVSAPSDIGAADSFCFTYTTSMRLFETGAVVIVAATVPSFCMNNGPP